MEVRSRSHGKRRMLFYGCATYHRRGRAVCSNGLEVPLDATEQAVIEDVERKLLTPAFVETVVRKVLTRAVPTGAALDEARTKFQSELIAVRRELDHLTEALARVGVSRALTDKLKDREARRDHLERELSGLERGQQVAALEVTRLEVVARQKALEWGPLMRRRTPQARQILAKVLRDKLVFRPEVRQGRRGYRLQGEGSVFKLLSGWVPGFVQAVASPRGIAIDYQPAFEGIWVSDRKAA